MIFAVDEAFKVRKKAKIRNRYNQVSHLTQNTIWEIDKIKRNHYMQESQESALFQQGTIRLQKQTSQKAKTNTNNENIHKRSTASERSVRKLLVGLN